MVRRSRDAGPELTANAFDRVYTEGRALLMNLLDIEVR
jgi:hypothetical protein